MLLSLASCVKGIYEGESAEVILKRSTEVLLGIDPEAAGALEGLSIRSVFDLASSHLFASAYKIAQETEGRSSLFSHVGAIPGDILDSSLVSMPPADIAKSGIEALREIG